MAHVVWVIPDNHRAHELYEYLHMNWPGGNQDMTEELGNAIFRSEVSPRTDGQNRGDLYLQQMRTVYAELQASMDEEDGLDEVHLRHLANTWDELDRAIAAGEMPLEWKKQFYDAQNR